MITGDRMMMMMMMKMMMMTFFYLVPYSGDSLRKMIDKQHEEIKEQLQKFAEIMKSHHVRHFAG